MNKHLIKANKQGKYIQKVDPSDYNWDYLEFNALMLKQGEDFSYNTEGKEAALVPLSGDIEAQVGGNSYNLQ